MTRLEKIEYRLNYLLSQSAINKNSLTYKIQLALLSGQRRDILQNVKPLEAIK